MPDAINDEPVQGIDMAAFTKSLIGDLENLRAGKMSVQQARAAAELARQVLRSMHLIVTAQKLIEARALPVPSATPAE